MSGNDFDSVPQGFQFAATEEPRFFAVRSGTQRLTGAGLEVRTDALCGRLAAAAIEKGALAGILLERCLFPITSFLAVLKAGGAFVPLDPSGQSDQRITQRTRIGQEGEAGARPQAYRTMVDGLHLTVIPRTRVNFTEHF
jgi:non-ribosomal peptide synthetase component F